MPQPWSHSVTASPARVFDTSDSSAYLIEYRGSTDGAFCRVRVVGGRPPSNHRGYFRIKGGKPVMLHKRSSDRVWAWGDYGGVVIAHETEVE